jgi:hypothetical protein
MNVSRSSASLKRGWKDEFFLGIEVEACENPALCGLIDHKPGKQGTFLEVDD